MDEDYTLYDTILSDNFLSMFTICSHEFEWLPTNIVLVTLFDDAVDELPPLFVTCALCAGLYPAPRYIELL